MENKKVSISQGNSKIGAIPSVSLPPIITCPTGAPCARKCYAVKLCRLYKTVKKAYQNNLDILESDPELYWIQVEAAARMVRFFRYHVSGDIPNFAYLLRMVDLAQRLPGVQFLAFTKRYNLINGHLRTIGEFPANLHIILSEWGAQQPDNPYGLPTSAVIFKGEQPRENWQICGGNCTQCAVNGAGCWTLKNGETIAFYEH